MKMKAQQLEIKAKDALKACLEKAPFISINFAKKKSRSADKNGDFLVELGTPSGLQKIIVEAKSSGQPRVVRGAILELLNLKRSQPSSYGVVVAPYISPNAAELCIKENVGFVDFAGNCRICFKNIFIEQSGNPNHSVVRREQRSLFSLRATRILRVLLKNPKKQWRIASLAQEAEVSLGHVFNVKKLLLDRELIAADDEGISLTNPDLLLNMWAIAYVSRKNSTEFFTLKSPAEFEADLAELCAKKNIPYALTGFSASSRYAPAVRSNRAMAYISGDADKIAEKLELKPVTRGANVTLIFPSDDGVYYDSQKIDGINIVSPLQAYLDLVGFRGRGDEAAEMILERKIRPTW